MRMQLVNFFVGCAVLLWATLVHDSMWPLLTGKFAEAMGNVCAMQEAQRGEEPPVQGLPEIADCEALKGAAYQRAYLHSGLVLLGVLAWGLAFVSGKKKWILLLVSSLTYGAIWVVKFLSISDFGQFLALSLSGEGGKLVAAVWREVVTPSYFAALMALSAALSYRASSKGRVDS